MKSIVASVLLLAVVPAITYAAGRHGLILDTVGPVASATPAPGTNGALVVYSAFDVSGHFQGIPQHLYHTDYEIRSDNDKVLRTVHNDSDTVVPGPAEVVLPPGKYRVVAQANGYGKVIVPVEVRSGLTTIVHLEGGGDWKTGTRPPPENAVLLPSGQRVGWKAASKSW